MRESSIESYLRVKVQALGGMCLKFTSPGRRNVPDRLVLIYGRAIFVELKAPGKHPTDGQLREHARLRAVGMTVHAINSIAGVDALIQQFKQ